MEVDIVRSKVEDLHTQVQAYCIDKGMVDTIVPIIYRFIPRLEISRIYTSKKPPTSIDLTAQDLAACLCLYPDEGLIFGQKFSSDTRLKVATTRTESLLTRSGGFNREASVKINHAFETYLRDENQLIDDLSQRWVDTFRFEYQAVRAWYSSINRFGQTTAALLFQPEINIDYATSIFIGGAQEVIESRFYQRH